MLLELNLTQLPTYKLTKVAGMLAFQNFWIKIAQKEYKSLVHIHETLQVKYRQRKSILSGGRGFILSFFHYRKQIDFSSSWFLHYSGDAVLCASGHFSLSIFSDI